MWKDKIPEPIWMAHNHQGELVDVKDLAIRHIQAKKLQTVSEMRFKAVDFVKWFITNFQEQPASILLEILGLKDSNRNKTNTRSRFDEKLTVIFGKSELQQNQLGLYQKSDIHSYILKELALTDDDLTFAEFKKMWEKRGDIPVRYSRPAQRKRAYYSPHYSPRKMQGRILTYLII